MIKYLLNHEIDKKKWDACISHSPNGNIYACSWYLDIVSVGWGALVENDYTAVFPLTEKRKLGMAYLCQPFFSQQLGLFSVDEVTSAQLTAFIEAIPPAFKLVEINLNTSNNCLLPQFYGHQNANFEMDLSPNYESLLAAFSENTKRNLKKARNAGLFMSNTVKPEELTALFKNNKGKQIKHFDETAYRILHTLMYQLIYRQAGHISAVYDAHNELCAGIFFAEFKNRIIFLFSASGEKARETGAMTLLVNTLVQTRAQQAKILDFEGSNDENLARFYKGFGAKKNIYLSLYLNKMYYFVKVFFRLYKFFK